MQKQLLLNVAAVLLASASITNAAFTPVPLQTSSYNADVIVEQNARPRLALVTDATVDNGTNNTASTWYEIGFDTANPSFGLPAAGSTFTAQDNANYTFKMPPSFTAPNGILIDTVITNGTFTLVTPAAYNLLSFMGSGGNGGDVIGVRVNHADGTFEVGSFGCPDWFGGSGVAYTAQGRINQAYNLDLQVNGANPRIYFRDVTLTNTTSAVTNIVLTYASGGANSHNDILGVSGASTPGGPVNPIVVTGFTYDFIVEASADKRGRVLSQTIVDGTNVWATSQSLDNTLNTGNSWYEQGYNTNNRASGPSPNPNNNLTGTGLPHPNTLITNAGGDHIYQLPASYTANNAVYISSDITNATITLTTPTAFSGLSFLASAGNGPVVVQAVVHHQDLSTETINLSIADWFNGSAAFVYIANGRVDVGNAQLNNVNGNNPRLLQNDIVLGNTTSPVTSIDLVNTNVTSGRFAILAVSGSAGALPPVIDPQPIGVNAYQGSGVSFTSGATANVPVTYQWQKGTNGVYVNLANGGNISGVTTTTLNIANITFADEADYRMVATDAAGSVNSGAAKLGVLSSLTDVTAPGDSIANLPNMSPFGDGPVGNAINNDLGQKWGSGVAGPSGCVVSPSVGATLVTGLRFYTANDAEERDPANYKLEGSTDGGSSYTLIASNSLSLPAGRNTTGGAPDPLTQFVQEVRFANSAGYSTYRLTFTNYKGGPGQGSMQLGEIEVLGVTTNILSAIVPSTAKAYVTTPLTITATVVGSPAPTARWQKQISGVFTDLNDSGVISGSHTASLTINPSAYSDAGLYRAIASNISGSSTSGVVQVTILSTNVDVTLPGDPITDFGNTSINPSSTDGAINENFASFVTRGSGLNNNAGFPPFAGPVGLVITPSSGSTVITGLRLYPGAEGTQQDPADVKLEGSNNGGTTYTTLIPTTTLAIPEDRNPVSTPAVDPLNTSVQELRFANTQAFTSYRLTFNNTKDNSSASALSIGELELLGLAVPSVTITPGAGGSIDITSSVPGTLQSNTNLATGVWISEGPISGTVNIVPNPAQPAKFYRVVNP